MSASGKYGELIARLAENIGQDRQLDLAIHIALDRCDPTSAYDEEGDCATWGEPREFGSAIVTEHLSIDFPRYTGSLDGALSIAETGWEYSISTLYCIARVELPLNDTRIQSESAEHKGCDVPRAICMAALRALIALDPNKPSSRDTGSTLSEKERLLRDLGDAVFGSGSSAHTAKDSANG